MVVRAEAGGEWGVRMPTASMFDPDALSHKLLKAIGPIDSEDIDIEADCSQMGTTKSVYVEIEATLHRVPSGQRRWWRRLPSTTPHLHR